jgi:hypothetical protein
VETLSHAWVDKLKSFETSKIVRDPGLKRNHDTNLYKSPFVPPWQK